MLSSNTQTQQTLLLGRSVFRWSTEDLFVFREAHFYTNDTQAAKTLLRTICCRKFTYFRPYLYLYRKKEGAEDFETGMLCGKFFVAVRYGQS